MNDSCTPWWAGELAPETAGEMARKYATLLYLVRDGERARQERGLRIAARRWPGSLRECQLVHPKIYAARLRASRRGALGPAAPRAAWRAWNCAAIPLWAEMHDLLADQLAWRARATTAGSDVRAFVAALDPVASTRWPSATTLMEVAGPRLGPRHAYGWLARQCGLEVAQLESLL